MVIFNCWECGKVMTNCEKTFMDVPDYKIFCKKCAKKHRLNQERKQGEV